MRRRAGVTAAGLALAIVMGVSVAAVAEGNGGGKDPVPGASAAKDKPADKKGSGWLADLAKRYGVPQDKLDTALRDVKIAIGDQGKSPTDPAVVAGLAGALGISSAEAKTLIKEVFADPEPRGKKGPGKPGGKKEEGTQISPAVVVDALAKELGIQHARAVALVADLDRLSRDHGNDPGDARFAAIAKGLGITPQRLEDALRAVKTRLSKVAEKPEPSGPASPKPDSPKPYTS
ncbi:hypothetical protein ACFYRN_38535 [Streptomyces sp. NPDC005227]|uniref:hypothetical protein n=1 Tax=unclassified Streptomyces TaxID=2593676 RepID=UPI0036A4B2A8